MWWPIYLHVCLGIVDQGIIGKFRGDEGVILLTLMMGYISFLYYNSLKQTGIFKKKFYYPFNLYSNHYSYRFLPPNEI